MLINDVNANVVLIHSQTQDKFHDSHTLKFVIIEKQLITTEKEKCELNIPDRIKTKLTPDHLCFVVFTSGSTGQPKAIQIQHQNFVSHIQSWVHLDIFNSDDIVLQLSACSFDAHTQEILGAMCVGATISMLKPNGHLDINYLSHVIKRTHVTYIGIVPTLLRLLCEFLDASNQFNWEKMVVETISMLMPHLPRNGKVNNCYGPAECTLVCCHHTVTQKDLKSVGSIPIGRPLANYQFYILDAYLQHVSTNQIGEIYVGGISVFPGYYNRVDLTNQALIDIPDVQGKCYRTGDLGRFNGNGDLVYCGRIDYQVKLRGQRIELNEIESCIMKSSSFVANCVVIKVHDDKTDQDYLAAYIQTESKDIQNHVKQYCQSHLSSYMVPSIVVLLEQLPLNENSKIDRKRLPEVDFSQMQHNNDYAEPKTDEEQEIHRVWCELLNIDKISTTENIFSIGGNSLILMRLMNYYQTHFVQQNLNISTLFQQPTIQQHARLVLINSNDNEQQRMLLKSKQWQPLNLTEGQASFSQFMAWFEEKGRFGSKAPAVYNIPLVLKVMNNTVSVHRFRLALLAVIKKNTVLRTKLIFSVNEKCLKQYVKPMPGVIITIEHDDYYQFEISRILCEGDFDRILLSELSKPHFNSELGIVLRCHIIKINSVGSDDVSEDVLGKNDMIIVNIDHVAFDGSSIIPFFKDLETAYKNPIEMFCETDNSDSLQYIDYSIHERRMYDDPSPDSDMNKARKYWEETFEGFATDKPHSLSYDHPEVIEQSTRSGNGGHVFRLFDNELVERMVSVTKYYNVTMFQLLLTCYHLFIYKTTNDNDVIISGLAANRYRPEIENIIGTFVNFVPYRLGIDPQITFKRLLLKMQHICLLVVQHSRLPFIDIFKISGGERRSTPPLDQVVFKYDNNSTEVDFVSLGDSVCKICYDILLEPQISTLNHVLGIKHNVSSNGKKHELSLVWDYDSDLFEEATIRKMDAQFNALLHLLFSKSSSFSHEQHSLDALQLLE
ncbi:unnamed protein product [Didymodactylos carnosus]|uniref:Carrier domain-containing protein n=1 Tax=Didymodactylos carnosus TaxID=1234261 RepID=A0A8S2E2G0_9BILA|nr:unnamed protein product [Didymodactylos carnosus]CAF3886102.1 unnamed protein product [Didymodactylos carnosus]